MWKCDLLVKRGSLWGWLPVTPWSLSPKSWHHCCANYTHTQHHTMAMMVGERTIKIRKSGVTNKHRSLLPCLSHWSLLFPAVRRSLLVSLWDTKFFYTEIALICVRWCESHVAHGNSACLPYMGHIGWRCRDTQGWLSEAGVKWTISSICRLDGSWRSMYECHNITIISHGWSATCHPAAHAWLGGWSWAYFCLVSHQFTETGYNGGISPASWAEGCQTVGENVGIFSSIRI